MKRHCCLAVALALGGSAAARQPASPALREITLANAHGMRVRILNLGATVTRLEVPDRDGHVANVALGFGTPAEYRDKNGGYAFGATIGRYAARIADARFSLNGKTYHLRPNSGPDALHGGAGDNYSLRVWRMERLPNGQNGVRLTLVSPDGDQGFPGTLTVAVTYRLRTDDALRIDYRATTTRPTVLNLTNHNYFTLGGAGSGSILDDTLQVNARRFIATNDRNIPTGKLAPVAGTPLDFRQPHRLGERIEAPSLAPYHGYDHGFVLDKPRAGALAVAAVLTDPRSGRRLTVSTTEPSIQLYTGNHLDGHDMDAEGHPLRRFDGVALEAQHFPDSPNHPSFPPTTLRPGQVFRSTTVWKFGVVR